jgi:hypothetical protein
MAATFVLYIAHLPEVSHSFPNSNLQRVALCSLASLCLLSPTFSQNDLLFESHSTSNSGPRSQAVVQLLPGC